MTFGKVMSDNADVDQCHLFKIHGRVVGEQYLLQKLHCSET